MSNPAGQLLIDAPAPSIRVLTLNRPDQRNAVRTSLLEDIADALHDADADAAVRAVVITGGPDIFAAGADIREMAAMSAVDAAGDSRPEFWRRIAAFAKPLIGAVNGYCLGAGNELLLRCDLAVAGPTARFGQPEINVGVMPGAGGAALLPRLIGPKRAARLAMLCEFLTAHEALSCGLVSHVSDKDALADAIRLAEKLSVRAPLAVEAVKDMIRHGGDMTAAQALAYERKHFSLLFATDDKREGVDAFLGKRKPAFRGV